MIYHTCMMAMFVNNISSSKVNIVLTYVADSSRPLLGDVACYFATRGYRDYSIFYQCVSTNNSFLETHILESKPQ